MFRYCYLPLPAFRIWLHLKNWLLCIISSKYQSSGRVRMLDWDDEDADSVLSHKGCCYKGSMRGDMKIARGHENWKAKVISAMSWNTHIFPYICICRIAGCWMFLSIATLILLGIYGIALHAEKEQLTSCWKVVSPTPFVSFCKSHSQ